MAPSVEEGRVKTLSPRERSKHHRALVRAILAKVGALPGVLMAANPAKDDPLRRAVGWPGKGAPDILYALAPLGQLRGLEVKTGTGRLDHDQKACHRAMKRFGVAVDVVHTVHQALEAVLASRHAARLQAELGR